jgi:hypothetical protein
VGNKVFLFDGAIYNDDRLYIFDLTKAKNNGRAVWSLATRRNCNGFPPTRVDNFKTKEKAIEYIKRIEPTTPCISMGGQSPKRPLSYNDYCKQLSAAGLPSALDIYELNKNTKREIIIEEIDV